VKCRLIAKLPESIEQILRSYALTAGAAGVGALALTQPSEAKIIYTPANVTLGAGNSIPIDLNHDKIVDFWLSRIGVVSTSFTSHLLILPSHYVASVGNGAVGTAPGRRKPAVALPRGAKIGPHQFFNNSAGMMVGESYKYSQHSLRWKGQWARKGKGRQNGYLGLKFQIKGKTHFGWARVSVTINGWTYTTTLTGYAYETVPNEPIIAGETKGPDDTKAMGRSGDTPARPPAGGAVLGLLALGAAGPSIRRREERVEAWLGRTSELRN